MQGSRLGRPRKIDDAALIASFYRVHLRKGPTSWTLADVALEAGVVPATLVQRFQSKIGLMAAAIDSGAEELAGLTQRSLEGRASPLAALHATIPVLTHGIEDPTMMANSLAQLHVELSHEELRPRVQAYSAHIVEVFQTIAAAAIEMGELGGIDADRLGGIIYTTWSGALVTYAISGQGELTAWVSGAIDQVLGPYMVHSPEPIPIQ
ncbi:MAG: TetR/AcrR family transcriptional regulator [Thermomicrobiales bacterium]